MNTKFELCYCDASGHKAFENAILPGAITSEQLASLMAILDEGTKVIADQIGLPSPIEEFHDEFGKSPDDHVWTSIERFDSVTPPAVEEFHTSMEPNMTLTIDDFMAKVAAVSKAGWDIRAEMERLDLDIAPAAVYNFALGG